MALHHYFYYNTIYIKMGQVPSCCIKGKNSYQSGQSLESNSELTLPPKKKNKVGFYEIILTPITSSQPVSAPVSRDELQDKNPEDACYQTNDYQLQEDSDQNEEQKLKEAPKTIQNRKISLDDFKLLYVLGKGAFCKVYLGHFKDKKEEKRQMYAIKQMKKSEVKKKKLVQNIKLQKYILKGFKSNFITRMHYAFRDDNYYYLVMEWAQGGDLYSFIKPGTKRRLLFRQAGQNAIRFILGCIVLSLEYLHSRDIIYSDLKPENILIYEDGYCKLTDFGVSKTIRKDERMTFKTGTRMYFAPEMVMGRNCKRYVDLWALGVIAYQLTNLFLPFHLDDISNKQKFQSVVRDAEKRKVWHNRNVSDQLKDFVNKILRLDPAERLGVNGWDAIKNHPFFKKHWFDWSKLSRRQLPSPLLPIIQEKLVFTRVMEGEVNNFSLEEWEERDKYETIADWSSCNEDFVVDG